MTEPDVTRLPAKELPDPFRQGDHFSPDHEEREGFGWPCCVCTWRKTSLDKAPCKKCEHYAT